MKFRVTPLSGLYKRIFICAGVLYQSNITRAKRIARRHKFETQILRFSCSDDCGWVAGPRLSSRGRGRRDLYSRHKEDPEPEPLSIWLRVLFESCANDAIRQLDCRFRADFASAFRSCDVRLVCRLAFSDAS